MNKLTAMSELELLRTHSAVLDELRRREVVRTRNNPIGDYTEWLVSRKMQLQMQANSQASFDAVDHDGVRYQIKGRRSDAARVQFSAIRNLDQNGFDYVIAVIFRLDYSIRLAVQLTHAFVDQYATYRPHVNAHILILGDAVTNHPDAHDLTEQLISS